MCGGVCGHEDRGCQSSSRDIKASVNPAEPPLRHRNVLIRSPSDRVEGKIYICRISALISTQFPDNSLLEPIRNAGGGPSIIPISIFMKMSRLSCGGQ